MNRLCGNPDKWFVLGRIFLFFLILSHTHHFLLNSPYTQALNHFTSFTSYQTNSIQGMRFLWKSSGSGLFIETSISYHRTIKCNPDPTYESVKMPVSGTELLSTINALYKELYWSLLPRSSIQSSKYRCVRQKNIFSVCIVSKELASCAF